MAIVSTRLDDLLCRSLSKTRKGDSVFAAWRAEVIGCYRKRLNASNTIEGRIETVSFIRDLIVYLIKISNAQILCKIGTLSRFRLAEKVYNRIPPEHGNVIPKKGSKLDQIFVESVASCVHGEGGKPDEKSPRKIRLEPA